MAEGDVLACRAQDIPPRGDPGERRLNRARCVPGSSEQVACGVEQAQVARRGTTVRQTGRDFDADADAVASRCRPAADAPRGHAAPALCTCSHDTLASVTMRSMAAALLVA
ncbi:hypothetical protein GCM10010264_18300 [Streptomyces globisporus]|nr:hypothetical protein GCM10010264_18300 [Streptomyces globisporus]